LWGDPFHITIGLYSSYILDHLYSLRIRVRARVLIVETIHVRHEKEEIGVHHGGCDGGQCIVVAELDLSYGQRVVLIDDGYDAHLQQFSDGILGIEIS
jgi:hypothetical protein